MSLSNIITTLAGVSIGSEKIYSYPTALPNSVSLPARIISYGGLTTWEWGSYGRLGYAYHDIEDLYLLRPVTQGINLTKAQTQLVAYVDSYTAKIKDIAAGLNPGAMIDDVAIDIEQVEYPIGGGVWYHAATITLSIKDSIK